jgi:hypothetical protein
MLGDELENLTLQGTVPINGFGNALPNAIAGNAAGNYLAGYAGADTLTGGQGNDSLQGGVDNDTLSDAGGANLLDGGAGSDSLTGGGGADLLIGGVGNDMLRPGAGLNIVAFNRGDGQDTVVSAAGATTTLSVGGGIQYADIALERVSINLVVHLGAGDRVTLNGWYQDLALQSVGRVQFVGEPMLGSSLAGSDPLRDQTVELFDFRHVVDRYDEARAAGFKGKWLAMDALLDAHLGGSDAEALGGDLGYRYGLGMLDGVGLAAAQSLLADPGFGALPQALRPLDDLMRDAVRLSG